MTVVKRSYSYLPTLASNTIYVLQTGSVSIDGSVTIPSCTAIVSSVNGGTTVYSSSKLTNGMFKVDRNTH